MEETFRALKAILKRHAGHLIVKTDTPRFYAVDAGFSERWKKEVNFGAVKLGKTYVSYHLIPVYACPDLLEDVSPELRKRMQGKSCFNFRTVDSVQLEELSRLTQRSVRRFMEVAQIRSAPKRRSGGPTTR